MNSINELKEEFAEIKDVFWQLRTKKRGGNKAKAARNSIYNFLTTFVSKAGSLIFTIILARILLPELFGFYSLALSTILLFTAISEMGLGQALVRFVSYSLGKNKTKKSRGYVFHFGKIRLALIFISSCLLVIFSKLIAESYYQKPIFLALLAGAIYLVFAQAVSFLSYILGANNNFKNIFFKEIIFQISRLLLVPLSVLYVLKFSLAGSKVLFYIILLLSVSYLVAGIYLFFVIRNRKYFSQRIQDTLSKKEKKEANRFVFLIAAISLSGVFFGSIDLVMLGRFVSGAFIGYYQAAFGIIGSLTALGMFGGALLPIFSQMDSKSLERAKKQALKIVFLLCFFGSILTFVFANFLIFLIYGQEYLMATNILKILVVLTLIIPLTGIYLTYYTSKNRPGIVARSLIFSTVINVVLNYFLITTLLKYGEIFAVYGAAIATVMSKTIYFFILIFENRRQ